MSDFCYGWPALNRIFRQAELMDRMIERIGVEPIVAVRIDQRTAWYEARTKCVDCASEQTCRRWLDCASVGSPPPHFCPNADFFRRCLENAALARHAA